jgi:hypothetical protein
MNLTDIKPTQTAQQFANSMQNTFGVTVDISKLDLDKSAQLLLSVNEEIQKQRLSEDRHKLHTTKSYLAKIFIKENLEKHIAELEETKMRMTPADKAPYDVENKKHKKRKGSRWDNLVIDDVNEEELNEFNKENTAAADAQPIPGQGGSSKGGFGAGKKIKPAGTKWEKIAAQVDEKNKKVDEGELDEGKGFTFDPKGFVALRKLVGSENMMRAKRAIEMAHDGKAVPAMFVKSFLPLIDMLDDIMMSGMANVQMLNNLTKRARKQLGVEESKEEISDKLRGLYESQEDQAELLLASKDVVDRVQKAVDDLSKLRNEDLPPLLDAMRDEVGAEISTAYANIVVPTLDQIVDANQMARETLSQASRILTGEEQVPQAMGVEAPVEEVPMDAEPMPEEDFETADVAAGEEEIGRAERE